MLNALRARVTALFLTLALCLGSGLAPSAVRMPTLQDLAIVAAMAEGVTPADICGRDGKALFDSALSHFCPTAGATALPAGHPDFEKAVLRAEAVIGSEHPSPVVRPRDPAHASRAPPVLSA